MLKPDQIPDAVADSMREFFHTRGAAQKAIAAALNAWPGMQLHQQDVNAQYSYFVIPLPQEKTDADSK